MRQMISTTASLVEARRQGCITRRRVVKLLAVLVIAIGWQSNVAFAQMIYNYVRNPSFEENSGCPNASDQIWKANAWSSIDTVGPPGVGKPDYCHSCAIYGMVMIPENFNFWQYPRTGNGLARVQVLYDEYIPQPNNYYRDYLQGRLLDTLTAGKAYCVTFWVTLADQSSHAVNRIGAYLDDGTIDTVASANCGLPQTQYTPQVQYVGGQIADTMNWLKVEGSFIANGTETFITIGNFYNLANTSYASLSGGGTSHYSWLLVDDVSVVELGLPAVAGNDTTIYEGGIAHLGVQGQQATQLDWKWYQGSTLIGTGASIDVQPMVNTTYRLEQTVCDSTTRDTVTVTVQPVGVSSVNYNEHVAVYPNPAASVLVIQMEGLTVSKYSITNNIGQIMLEGTLSSQRTELSIKSLIPGVYNIRLEGQGYSEVRRFIKQ